LEYQQILSEVIESQNSMSLLERYDEKITALEVSNKQATKQRDQKVGLPTGKLTPRHVNISLPPFTSPANEPYGDSQTLKFGT
jgi:hypothetical protein